MVNILRMDAYRLVRSKSLWICLGLIVFFVALAAGMLAWTTSPEYIEAAKTGFSAASGSWTFGVANGPEAGSGMEELADSLALLSSTSQITYIGSMMVKGGALALAFIIFISIFLASEFESGFSKNVFASHPNRLAFLGARLIEIVVLAAVFVTATIVSSLVSAAIAGFDLAPSPVGDIVLWGALVTLMLTAFGMITALTVWLTRKMSAAIVAGVLLVTGLIAALIRSVVSLMPGMSHLSDFMLTSCMESLGLYGLDGAGALGIGHIAAVGIAFVVIFAVLSALVLKKKDI